MYKENADFQYPDDSKDSGNGGGAGSVINLGKTGHFTQIVWKDTKELGVGSAKGSNGQFKVCFLVIPAMYDPRLPFSSLRWCSSSSLRATFRALIPRMC